MHKTCQYQLSINYIITAVYIYFSIYILNYKGPLRPLAVTHLLYCGLSHTEVKSTLRVSRQMQRSRLHLPLASCRSLLKDGFKMIPLQTLPIVMLSFIRQIDALHALDLPSGKLEQYSCLQVLISMHTLNSIGPVGSPCGNPPSILIIVGPRDVLGSEAHDVQAQRVDALRQLVLGHRQRHALACREPNACRGY